MPGRALIPFGELAVAFCEAGAFAAPKNRMVHSKTCPHAILAQAVQGRYEIACDDGRHAILKEGEAFLTSADLPLRITHHGDPSDGYRMRARWLHLHCTLFGSVDALSLLDLPLRVTAVQCAPFVPIIDALLALQRREDAGLGAAAHRQELGMRALRLLCELAPMRASKWLRREERLAPVLAYMREHAAEKLTVADLARRACLSAPHFHALFRQCVGRPPMKHLKYLRLTKACRLLAKSDAPLEAVAGQTGFCNEFHLSREFRRAFGKPPGVWRREYDRSLV